MAQHSPQCGGATCLRRDTSETVSARKCEGANPETCRVRIGTYPSRTPLDRGIDRPAGAAIFDILVSRKAKISGLAEGSVKINHEQHWERHTMLNGSQVYVPQTRVRLTGFLGPRLLLCALSRVHTGALQLAQLVSFHNASLCYFCAGSTRCGC